MNNGIDRNLGEQPVLSIMVGHGLARHDLVAASSDQITHKMVSRACKGRRLSRRAQLKILAREWFKMHPTWIGRKNWDF